MLTQGWILITLSYFLTTNANDTEFTLHPKYYLFPQSPECGVSTISLDSGVRGRIIGGSNTTLGEFPWMVTILQRFRSKDPKLESQNRDALCGGAILNNRYILTAGHCAKKEKRGIPRESIVVTVGDWDTTTPVDSQQSVQAPPSVDILVEEVIPHPDYNENSPSPNSQTDIALLRLMYPITFNDFVKPICLPFNFEAEQDKYVGSKVTEAGWGRYENGKVPAPILQKSSTTIANWEKCRQHMLVLSKSHVCVNESPYNRACSGDSGSPLMYIELEGSPIEQAVHYIVGVHSWGIGKCEAYDTRAKFSGYVWVRTCIKWILDSIKH